MTNPFSWAVNQLANAQRVERKVPRFNPRPPGVIHAGSASEAVLRVLRDNPRTYFTNGALMRETGRTHAAVSWALKYLREQGLVKAIGDTSRNERWLKYAAVIGATDVEVAAKPGVEAGPKRLAGDEAAVPSPEVQRLGELRGAGNTSVRTVADQLRPVPGGHGTAAKCEQLAREAGCQWPLLPGQCDLDGTNGAGESAPLLPQADLGGPDDDSGPGGTPCWQAIEHDAGQTVGTRPQPRSAEDRQAIDVAHAPGLDAADSRMDSPPESPSHGDCETPLSRHARGNRTDSRARTEGLGLFDLETLKAIAA